MGIWWFQIILTAGSVLTLDTSLFAKALQNLHQEKSEISTGTNLPTIKCRRGFTPASSLLQFRQANPDSHKSGNHQPRRLPAPSHTSQTKPRGCGSRPSHCAPNGTTRGPLKAPQKEVQLLAGGAFRGHPGPILKACFAPPVRCRWSGGMRACLPRRGVVIMPTRELTAQVAFAVGQKILVLSPEGRRWGKVGALSIMPERLAEHIRATSGPSRGTCRGRWLTKWMGCPRRTSSSGHEFVSHRSRGGPEALRSMG